MRVKNMVIKGTEQSVPVGESSAEDIITLRKAYIIGGSVRGLTETHDVELEKDDFVELVFNDDTTWYCNTDTIDEVFPGAAKVNRSGDAVFEVPVALVSTDVERGIAGSILLKGLNIFAKKAIDKKVQDVAADFEKKQLENTSGLYRLDETFQLQPFNRLLSEVIGGIARIFWLSFPNNYCYFFFAAGRFIIAFFASLIGFVKNIEVGFFVYCVVILVVS